MDMDKAIKILEETIEYAEYKDMLQEDLDEANEAIDYLKSLPAIESQDTLNEN